ncbi:MAG: hypothetical protein H0U38_04490 [Chloroflexia bacterium]|nr:hypothetical protein [Chloroflexia bacterium]
MVFGTLSTLDDLANVQTSVLEYGEQTLAQRVAQALTIHNTALEDAIADFAIITNQYQLPYGVSDDMEMQELDQYGSPDVQKHLAGGAIGLPLRFYGIAVQWNRHFLLNASVATLARLFDSAASSDRRNVTLRIRQRLLNPTNTIGYRDLLQTKLTYDVHALLNGDGMGVPSSPTGETFDGGTHTHFNAEAALSAAGLTALIDDVVEHGVDGSILMYINRADEAAVRGFAGFTAYVDARIQPASTQTVALGTFDVTNPADRAIGLYDGAEVHVKPWVPDNYQIAFDRTVGTDKPLAIRTRSGNMAGDAYQGGFGQLFEDEDHPLRARGLGREFGVGANQRHKAAVNFSNGATYVSPTLS